MNPIQTMQTLARSSRLRRWLGASVLMGLGLTVPAAMGSLNVVGYVNVALTNGYTFVANPLSSPPNHLTNVIPYMSEGGRAYFWDLTNQVFLPTATFTGGSWNLNYDFPVGRGVVLYSPIKYTNTFVGEVLQGNVTNAIAGNNGFTIIGSKVPVGGPLASELLFPSLDGASVHFFRSSSQTFSDGYTCFTNYGWFDPKGIEGTNGPSCSVAESFVVQNPGPPTNWVRNFVVNAPPIQTGLQTSYTIVPIDELRVHDGLATLEWTHQPGTKCDIQFSTDGNSWTTVDTKVSGSKWTGPLPDPLQGRFRIVIAASQGGGQ